MANKVLTQLNSGTNTYVAHNNISYSGTGKTLYSDTNGNIDLAGANGIFPAIDSESVGKVLASNGTGFEWKRMSSEGGGGGGGTDNYNDLSNRPRINGNIISGNTFGSQYVNAGTGLVYASDNKTLNHSNAISAQNTQEVYNIKYDAQGHITSGQLYNPNWTLSVNNRTVASPTDSDIVKTVPYILQGTDANRTAVVMNYTNTASGIHSVAEGYRTIASGDYSHAESYQARAVGYGSHAEGSGTIANGSGSHAEGCRTFTSEGASDSHVEGYETKVYGVAAHAEGRTTLASGSRAHAEGYQTTAIGSNSHAEGANTVALGLDSHAEGSDTTASGYYTHTEGYQTIASGTYQHAQGRYNVEDSEGKYVDIVG